jgi:hypothetical protein
MGLKRSCAWAQKSFEFPFSFQISLKVLPAFSVQLCVSINMEEAEISAPRESIKHLLSRTAGLQHINVFPQSQISSVYTAISLVLFRA